MCFLQHWVCHGVVWTNYSTVYTMKSDWCCSGHNKGTIISYNSSIYIAFLVVSSCRVYKLLRLNYFLCSMSKGLPHDSKKNSVFVGFGITTRREKRKIWCAMALQRALSMNVALTTPMGTGVTKSTRTEILRITMLNGVLPIQMCHHHSKHNLFNYT